MSMPGFSAVASVYQTSRHYRSSVAHGDLDRGQGVEAAYFPSQQSMRDCYTCLEKGCSKHLFWCQLIADATCLLAPFLCLSAHGTCWGEYGLCLATCHLPGDLGSGCCPKPCQVPNPLRPGVGCCDEGEHCVDEHDPNSRGGCCPRDRSVCGNRCCLPGENCCGDQCCPSHFFCLDGFCSEFPGPLLPPKGPPPPPSPRQLNPCMWGWTPCNGQCCAPNQECCPDGVCRWSCLK